MLIRAQHFFNQKKTKLKYITQQIALFKVYSGYVKKGYSIVGDGLSAIDDIKHGDFDLHNNYFNSLKQASKSVKEYAQTDSFTAIQNQILSINTSTNKFAQESEYIQPQEKEYINTVLSNLLLECDKDLEQLEILTADSVLSLKVDERLKRIEEVHADLKDKYSFVQYFETVVKKLALLRAKDINDATLIKKLYDIK
jgi:hypothetical protein